MPNNICNFALFPMTEKERTKKPLKALEKLDRVCSDIQKGIVKKRGWSVFSGMLGKSQNIAYPKMEAKVKASFLTDDTCAGCGLSVNICPKQSCTVYFRKKPKKQYKGI